MMMDCNRAGPACLVDSSKYISAPTSANNCVSPFRLLQQQAALRNEAMPLHRIDADKRVEIGAGGTLRFESEEDELFR